MMLLKQTYSKIKDNLMGEKAVFDLQNSFLFQLVFLSTVRIFSTQIKDYIYKSKADETVFVIPDSVKTSAKKNKKILVLDMDETLVHTRSSSKPLHKHYSAIPVHYIIYF